MSKTTPVLNIRELYGRRQTRDTARLSAYNSLLQQIHHRIKVSSQLPTHPTSLMYTIPPFILGLPKLDLEDCVIYLVYQLRTSGFEVKYTYPNMLYISWKHHEKEYLMNESPILRAMIDTTDSVGSKKKRSAPAQPKSILKKEEPQRVSFAPSPVFTDFNPAAPPPPPRNALEYVPPATFINSIQGSTPHRFY